jgi:hypothetical protein
MSSKPIPFWSNEPTILLNKSYIGELWPTPKMTYEQKLNAVSRLVILLSILGFIFTMSVKMLIVGVITLVVLFVLYKTQPQKITKDTLKESFVNSASNVEDDVDPSTQKIINPETLEIFLKSQFEENTKTNPMANVLLTDIGDNPNRKSAPPAFNVDVYEDITKSTKKMVQKLNPGIKNTNKQLFGDLGEKWNLDQSMRRFYSTANTKVANDQGAFAQFLYGNMPSAKEGDPFALVQDNPRYNLY